ncbi:MAG: hypothetical protein F6K28_51515 [Microcoleus sp. SIO2G3]|nr:hypothetical protein [Microcoleus sp. SIO2G3]
MSKKDRIAKVRFVGASAVLFNRGTVIFQKLNSSTLLEQEAIVTLTIAPGRAGQVQFQGSWWKARCAEALTLVPGTIVYVVDRQYVTTLYVEPAVTPT